MPTMQLRPVLARPAAAPVAPGAQPAPVASVTPAPSTGPAPEPPARSGSSVGKWIAVVFALLGLAGVGAAFQLGLIPMPGSHAPAVAPVAAAPARAAPSEPANPPGSRIVAVPAQPDATPAIAADATAAAPHADLDFGAEPAPARVVPPPAAPAAHESHHHDGGTRSHTSSGSSGSPAPRNDAPF